jgi:hypothetical protein
MTAFPTVLQGEPEVAQRRPRRKVGSAILTMVRPLFRFSRSRNAYVLRGVGDRRGPVLRA